jgi:glycine cleavage system protein P-like pyridoxal-binding family
MQLIYERSRPGRRAGRLPSYEDLPAVEIPAGLRRERPPRLPEVSEPELVRHFTALADRNFGIDTGFYPLGRDYPGLDDALLVAVTERRTVEDIDRLAEALA